MLAEEETLVRGIHNHGVLFELRIPIEAVQKAANIVTTDCTLRRDICMYQLLLGSKSANLARVPID